MNGNRLLLDTNIVLYLLSGDKTLARLLNGKQVYLSFITELELLSFKGIRQAEMKLIRQFLDDCTIIDINASIKKLAINIRSKSNIKLPDSLIVATALFLNVPLISADKKIKTIPEISLILYDR